MWFVCICEMGLCGGWGNGDTTHPGRGGCRSVKARARARTTQLCCGWLCLGCRVGGCRNNRPSGAVVIAPPMHDPQAGPRARLTTRGTPPGRDRQGRGRGAPVAAAAAAAGWLHCRPAALVPPACVTAAAATCLSMMTASERERESDSPIQVRSIDRRAFPALWDEDWKDGSIG